jgi:hypothetical protein
MAVQTCGTDAAPDVVAALSEPCKAVDSPLIAVADAAQLPQQQQQQCSVETILCTKCERNVPTANMGLHTVRCRGVTSAAVSSSNSNNCSNVTSSSNNSSSTSSCSRTNLHSASSTISAHAANSAKTQSSDSSRSTDLCACPWCELGFTAADLPKHADACGARTERYTDTVHYTLYA